jgi:hypothetical protein
MDQENTAMGNQEKQFSADTREYKVTDPARIADGYYGTTFHKTKQEAERRVAMFPGSVMESVGEAS